MKSSIKTARHILPFFPLLFLFGLVHSASAQSDVVFDVRRVVVNLEYGQIIGAANKVDENEELDMGGRWVINYGDDFVRTSNFSEREIQHLISKSLVDHNLTVSGYDDPFEELRNQILPDFAVVFYMEEFNFNYTKNIDRLPYRYRQFSSLTRMRVRVLSGTSNVICFDRIIPSTFFSNEKGFTSESPNFSNYIPKMFDKFVDDLLADPEFKSLLESKPTRSEMLPDSSVVLPAMAVDKPTPLSKALSSTVTLQRGSSHGSGAIISADGLILTCYHNLYAANEVEVVLSNGITAKAKVLKKDVAYDLALLQLEGLETEPLFLSPKISATPGEDAWAIGTPGFTELGQSITKGIISGNRIIEGKDYIQTDASVSPGNSGGPLLDGDGRILGIVNAKVVSQGTEGIGFAIPARVAMERLGLSYK